MRPRNVTDGPKGKRVNPGTCVLGFNENPQDGDEVRLPYNLYILRNVAPAVVCPGPGLTDVLIISIPRLAQTLAMALASGISDSPLRRGSWRPRRSLPVVKALGRPACAALAGAAFRARFTGKRTTARAVDVDRLLHCASSVLGPKPLQPLALLPARCAPSPR
jgi:hypothetical protein